jgi:hypothetical protein
MWEGRSISLVALPHYMAFMKSPKGGDGVISAVNNLTPDHPTLNSSLAFVFAHSSSLNPTEARLLREFDQYVSITPESEMHYGLGHLSSYLVRLLLLTFWELIKK